MVVRSNITGFCAGFHLFAGQEIDLPDDVIAALGDDVETNLNVADTPTIPEAPVVDAKAQPPVQDKMVKSASNKSLGPDPSAPDQEENEEDQEIDE